MKIKLMNLERIDKIRKRLIRNNMSVIVLIIKELVQPIIESTSLIRSSTKNHGSIEVYFTNPSVTVDILKLKIFRYQDKRKSAIVMFPVHENGDFEMRLYYDSQPAIQPIENHMKFILSNPCFIKNFQTIIKIFYDYVDKSFPHQKFQIVFSDALKQMVNNDEDSISA